MRRSLEEVETKGRESPVGRSVTVKIGFTVKGSRVLLKVFTARPDMLYGVTFIVVAPESEMVAKVVTDEQKAAVEAYIRRVAKKTDLERHAGKKKTGVFTGAYAINPINGEAIPIWVADYILPADGTTMAVPAHHEHDFAFAKAFDLPIRQVIAPEVGIRRENEQFADGGSSVVFDPKAQKYAFLEIDDNSRIALFAGGLQEGEGLHEGILRELREESGLTHIRHYEEICTVYGHYYHSLKKLNRRARATVLLVILKDAKTVATQLEEHEKFHTVWLDAADVLAKWQATEGGHYDHYLIALRRAVGRAIELGYDKTSNPKVFTSAAITGEGVMVHSGSYDGLESGVARKKIIADLKLAQA